MTQVQLTLNQTEIECLNWLMEVCDIKSQAEIFNVALTLLEWAVKEVSNDAKIASFKDQERNILSMPALDEASKNGKKYF